MKTIYKRDGYIAEPHGAVGYLGLKREKITQTQLNWEPIKISG
jgi:threonine synthase